MSHAISVTRRAADSRELQVNVEELNVLEDKLGAMSLARTYAVS